MARPKLIADNILIDTIKAFFKEEGTVDSSTTEIVKYIKEHGCPQYTNHRLKQNPLAVQTVEDEKNKKKDKSYTTCVAYKTIDAATLIRNNPSRDSLIKAINNRDAYYKLVADSAVQIFDEHKNLSKQNDALLDANQHLVETISDLETQIHEKKKACSDLQKELKVYKSVVDTYVYPEMANILLEKEGAIRKTEPIIDEDTFNSTLITSTTNIKESSKSKSKIIEGLFNL